VEEYQQVLDIVVDLVVVEDTMKLFLVEKDFNQLVLLEEKEMMEETAARGIILDLAVVELAVLVSLLQVIMVMVEWV
tara:strand:+ start:191 stop:421 length:231 start_codon:yes stop_codon:yes gene_type:complete